MQLSRFKQKLLSSLLFLSIFTFALAQTIPISYQKAVQFALQHNPKIHAANASIAVAEGAYKQAQSLAWPKLNLDVAGSRTDNPLSVFGYKLSQGNATFNDFGASEYTGPSTLFTKPNALNHPGFYNNIDTALVLSIPIYTGGKIKATEVERQALIKEAQRGNQEAQNQLAYQVYATYERYLTSNSLVSLARSHVKQARIFVSTTEILTKQSITLETDLLLAKSYLNNALLELTNTQIQQENELDTFRSLLGQPTSLYVPMRHSLLHRTRHDKEPPLIKIMTHNPTLLRLEEHLKAEKSAILGSKSLYKPQVAMQLRHEWNGNALDSGLSSDSITLGANWLLLSAGNRTGAIQEAQAAAEKTQFELDDQRNQLILQLKQIEHAEQQAKNDYHLTTNTINQLELAMPILSQRYGRGVLPLNPLLDNELQIMRNKAHALQAEHQLRLLQAQRLMLGNQLIQSAMAHG